MIGRRFFGLKGIPAVVAGFAAGQANTVFVGVPMILKAYGDEGAVPLFLLIAVHLPVTMTLATILAEGRRASPLLIVRRLLTHPIVVGIIAGSTCRPLRPMCRHRSGRSIDLLGERRRALRAVSMGIALRRYGIAMGWKLPTVISVLKLIVHPLIVLLLATLRLRDAAGLGWGRGAVRLLSLGHQRLSVRRALRRGRALASSAVSLSTVLALGTTLLWLSVLGVG